MRRPFSSIAVASTTATSKGFPAVRVPCRTRFGYSPIRQSKNSTDPSLTGVRAASLRYGNRRRMLSRAAHVSNPVVVAPPVRSVSSYRRPASADRARASGISFARDEPPIQENAIDPRSGTNRRTASSASISRARRAFDRNRSVIPGVSWAAVAPRKTDDRVPMSSNPQSALTRSRSSPFATPRGRATRWSGRSGPPARSA